MIDSNALSITRGNSAVIDITPIDEETQKPIRLEEGDKVLFTIKSNAGTLKLQKTLTSADYSDISDDSLNCFLEPEDTIDWRPAEYLYDCLLVKSDGTTVTFISSIFVVEEALGVYTD